MSQDNFWNTEPQQPTNDPPADPGDGGNTIVEPADGGDGGTDPGNAGDPPPTPTDMFKDFRDGTDPAPASDGISEPGAQDPAKPADITTKEGQTAPPTDPQTPPTDGNDGGGEPLPDEVAFTQDLAKDWQQYGILGKEVKPEDIRDYDDLMNKLEQEKSAEVDARFRDFMNQLVQEDADYFQFRKNGGSLQDYLKLYADDPSTSFDISSESGQEAFVRNLLKTENKLSDAEVETQLEFLKTHDKLEEYSTNAFQRVKQQKEMTRQQKLADMEHQRLKEREQIVQNINKAKQIKDLSGVKLTDREASALANFAYNPSEQTEDGGYTTGFYKQLRSWQNEKPEMFMLIAELVKSEFKTLSAIQQVKNLQKKTNRANALAHVGRRPNPAPAGGGSRPPANVTEKGAALWEGFVAD